MDSKTEAHARRSKIALGFALICGVFLLETAFAHRTHPSPLSPWANPSGESAGWAQAEAMSPPPSFNGAIKALGAARWQALHRTVYATALLALLHFFWMRAGKNDFAEWSIYAAVLGGLLGWRLWKRLKPRAATS